MVQIFTSVKNTFVHAHVGSPDRVEMGGNACRRASSTPALATRDAAENEKYNALACGALGLQLLPLPPHDDDDDDDDYASVHAHPGPSPLDMDVEGMLGFRALETDTDDDDSWGLAVWQPRAVTTPDFRNEGMDIEDMVSEEIEDHSSSALTYHGLTHGAQLQIGNYEESPAQTLSCLSTAPSTPHKLAQGQLCSASNFFPCEEEGDSYMQSYSGHDQVRVQCNAKHEDTQDEEKRTTVMLMNLPRGYTNSKLMRTIDSEGFASMYDFIYVPMVAARTSKGYAFVNLVNPFVAQRFVSAFNGFSRWSTASKNSCHVVWAEKHQGLHANIQHYRNSTVLGGSVPDDYKPRIFKNGEEMPFPPPNRKPSIPTQSVRRQQKTNKPLALSL